MSEEITTPETGAGTEPEKTFTQEEVDALIAKRVAREKKGLPSAEELDKFRTWQKEQQTEQEKLGTVTRERDEASKALEETKQENCLLKMGVAPDDVDYYVFKIRKLVTDNKDFETAAKEYLKGNKPKSAVTVEMGAKAGGNAGTKSVNEQMNDLIRNAR